LAMPPAAIGSRITSEVPLCPLHAVDSSITK
jgi:hypothetical protein